MGTNTLDDFECAVPLGGGDRTHMFVCLDYRQTARAIAQSAWEGRVLGGLPYLPESPGALTSQGNDCRCFARLE
eukprot:3478711-Alexandrium_andersonii.AAC.1